MSAQSGGHSWQNPPTSTHSHTPIHSPFPPSLSSYEEQDELEREYRTRREGGEGKEKEKDQGRKINTSLSSI